MANNNREYSIKELKELNEQEKQLFAEIENENVEEVEKLLETSKMLRINCLDHNGMSPLDQASFKGNQDLVEMLLARGANADNRAHDQGYTALMFAALAGKPRICQMLLDAGANPQAVNMIGKTAGELAAFVGQHECVGVISSHIGIEDVDRILHPQGENSVPQYPRKFVQFIHQLTRTHSFHPIKLVLEIAKNEKNGAIWEHRKKAIWTIDRLFERQLRSKQPNEVQSIKLWLILHTFRELLKYVDERKTTENPEKDEEESTNEQKLALNFARMLLNDRPENAVRQNEEQFIRQAIAAFPYKQSMLWQSLSKQFGQIQFGHPPPAFTVLCHSLLGPRFVQTAHFCRTCAIPSAQKRCKNCKLFYCSVECQRFDWPIHKKCCDELKRRREEQEKEEAENGQNIVLQG